ncbi:MAG: hypothetical protein ACT4O5_13880 [Gammaproteobacteria bacterium]
MLPSAIAQTLDTRPPSEIYGELFVDGTEVTRRRTGAVSALAAGPIFGRSFMVSVGYDF